MALNALRDAIPEPARDLKLNLEAVLTESSLDVGQRWAVAAATAIASRNPRLRVAVLAEARAAAGDAVVDDAIAAAAIMGMNNVLYRFRHLIDKPSYGEMRARLRMNRLVKPAGSKTDFELICLAVSAVNGCESCIRAHEKVALEGGRTEEQVWDAIRIASVMHGAAVALDLAAAEAGQTMT
jgi:alkyl hydroperoxide reductase subunit D